MWRIKRYDEKGEDIMALTDKNGTSVKTYTLMGTDKKLYKSETPGTYGGHRQTKV
jgi:hypothetical protein